jgi:folate-binding protein YgfZ
MLPVLTDAIATPPLIAVDRACIVRSDFPACGFPMVPILLEPAELVEFAGNDAIPFAQAQFSSDVAQLAVGAWHWSAWLDAQGRVRHLFALLRPDTERLLAWLPRGRASELATGLSPYIFRSRLSISVLPDLHLHDAQASIPAPGTIGPDADGWAIGLPGTRSALLARAAAGAVADTNRLATWQLADVDLGMPWVDSEVQAQFTAQALGLDRLGAFSVAKGCYPGQEVVARLHFRGGNKRSCWQLRVDDGMPLPPGTRLISADGSPQGTVLHAARVDEGSSRALAVLPIDLAAGTTLNLESGVRVEVLAPAHSA